MGMVKRNWKMTELGTQESDGLGVRNSSIESPHSKEEKKGLTWRVGTRD